MMGIESKTLGTCIYSVCRAVVIVVLLFLRKEISDRGWYIQQPVSWISICTHVYDVYPWSAFTTVILSLSDILCATMYFQAEENRNSNSPDGDCW